MKKTIYSKFDKKLITELPIALFPGRIITIINENDADKAVDYLLSCDILGVDTETRPMFRKGEQHKVALLQVASRDTCFLFRLNDIGIPPSVIRLLEDCTVPKIGLSWHDDLLSLHRRVEFNPGYFVDLQDIVKEIGIKDLSLQKLYAATDAWACIKLYEEIKRLYKTKEYTLVVSSEPMDSDASHNEEVVEIHR